MCSLGSSGVEQEVDGNRVIFIEHLMCLHVCLTLVPALCLFVYLSAKIKR